MISRTFDLIVTVAEDFYIEIMLTIICAELWMLCIGVCKFLCMLKTLWEKTHNWISWNVRTRKNRENLKHFWMFRNNWQYVARGLYGFTFFKLGTANSCAFGVLLVFAPRIPIYIFQLRFPSHFFNHLKTVIETKRLSCNENFHYTTL